MALSWPAMIANAQVPNSPEVVGDITVAGAIEFAGLADPDWGAFYDVTITVTGDMVGITAFALQAYEGNPVVNVTEFEVLENRAPDQVSQSFMRNSYIWFTAPTLPLTMYLRVYQEFPMSDHGDVPNALDAVGFQVKWRRHMNGVLEQSNVLRLPVSRLFLDGYHTADINVDSRIDLDELLRVIQLYNTGGFHCSPGTEDGYAPGYSPMTQTCSHHAADYSGSGSNWIIDIGELLRVIQIYNSGYYYSCPDVGTEDGFCAYHHG